MKFVNYNCTVDKCVLCALVSLLRDLKHANIVTLHDIIHTDSCLTLVFEYLVRILRRNVKFSYFFKIQASFTQI